MISWKVIDCEGEEHHVEAEHWYTEGPFVIFVTAGNESTGFTKPIAWILTK